MRDVRGVGRTQVGDGYVPLVRSVHHEERGVHAPQDVRRPRATRRRREGEDMSTAPCLCCGSEWHAGPCRPGPTVLDVWREESALDRRAALHAMEERGQEAAPRDTVLAAVALLRALGGKP